MRWLWLILLMVLGCGRDKPQLPELKPGDVVIVVAGPIPGKGGDLVMDRAPGILLATGDLEYLSPGTAAEVIKDGSYPMKFFRFDAEKDDPFDQEIRKGFDPSGKDHTKNRCVTIRPQGGEFVGKEMQVFRSQLRVLR